MFGVVFLVPLAATLTVPCQENVLIIVETGTPASLETARYPLEALCFQRTAFLLSLPLSHVKRD